jgi:hypothetical protein
LKLGTNTPKALANFSPGLERSDNPGLANLKILITLKGFDAGGTLTGFKRILFMRTQGCRFAPTAGLKLANASGVLIVGFEEHKTSN